MSFPSKTNLVFVEYCKLSKTYEVVSIFKPDPVSLEMIKECCDSLESNTDIMRDGAKLCECIRSDIRNMPRNNLRYLEYYELRRTCL